ncbi:MAG TPA: sulfite exporter TauE/SafE family protein [Ramlibacter sp.]|nr:sulfite exporter TauE/SafE family protein [Ramlibacter sp.]
MIDSSLVLTLAVLGVATGFLAGLLGIGGAVLMVPVITFLLRSHGYPPEFAPKMSIATSLATICFTSLSSLRAHHQRGAVLWRLVGLLAPGIVIGSLIGVRVAVALPARLLTGLFAVFLIVSATQMLLDRKPSAARRLPGAAGTSAVGVVIGIVSALVGAGGAFISVPFMTACNVRIHQAVGTAAALGFPIALAGTAGYLWAGRALPHLPWSVGYLYLPGLVTVSLASIMLAPVGARVAHGMQVRPLRRVFALFVYALSAYTLLK